MMGRYLSLVIPLERGESEHPPFRLMLNLDLLAVAQVTIRVRMRAVMFRMLILVLAYGYKRLLVWVTVNLVEKKIKRLLIPLAIRRRHHNS